MKQDARNKENERPVKVLAKKRSLIAAGIAISLMAAPSVWAQQTAPVERIEVTGTRIPSPNIESTSPITSIDAQSIRVDGVRSVEDMLNNLPQVFADQGGNIANGSTGTATVNLRNLGATRTLVLVNGRRLPAGSPGYGGYATDLNEIPLPLIKRVDVLTGGASAVYGSDAIAGVVNFIMNDNFQGAQIQLNQSFYNHSQHNAAADRVKLRNFSLPGNINSDGEVYDANLLLGGNFGDGKGNATVYLGYKKDQAVLQSQRDYSACAFGGGSDASGLNCGGSSTSYPGRFIVASGNRTVADSLGNTRPWVKATDVYNYGPLNYFQRPDERYTFWASAHYDAADNARVYTEFGFHDDHTLAQIAPSGLFGFDASGPNAIRFENPLLSADWKTQLGLTAPGQTADAFILRRNVEGGGRVDDLRHTSFRGVVGVKGDFAKYWNYDAFMQTGKVVYQETYKNDFSIARAARAMNVVTDPATGQPVCQSKLDGTDPNCVPYNIWSLGGVTPAALNYLQTPGFQKGYTSQSVQGVSVTGDLGNYGVKLPAAKNGVSVAFGLERRVEKLNLETDTEFSTGDLFGQGGPTIGLGGQYTVNEAFMEARAPLIEGRQFADLLSVNGSYRHSDYSTGKQTDSSGVGVEWAPVKKARFRASYQHAVRAANVSELFTAQGIALYNNNADPCAGATPTATLAQCEKTGVTAAQYGTIADSTAGQYNYLQGGNPNLNPETSNSYTLGMVFTPVNNLNASFDLFKINVKDVIDVQPPTVTLQECIQTGDPKFCSLIFRDRLGTLWATPQAYIIGTNQNLGSRATSGIDLAANYIYRLNNYGRLSFNFMGTYLKEFKSEPIPGLGSYDCAGLYGSTCGTPLPKWRHTLRTTWFSPWDLELALTWRHIASVDLDATSSNPMLNGPVPEPDRMLSARDYFDLYGAYALTKKITLAGGINNLFDRDPPVTGTAGAPFGNGNTYPQVYDALGRRVFVNLTAKF